MPVWRNGSRGRLKIYFKQLSAGSSPVTGNRKKRGQSLSFFLSVTGLEVATMKLYLLIISY